jgi:hypothetical protein
MGVAGEASHFTLSQGLWDALGRVSEAENVELMVTFTNEEHDEVLASMKVDTTPGLDGLPVIFFKKLWMLVKPYILAILNGFALGRVDISRLNFGVLSLIPKAHDADEIRLFRPIALINVTFKFVAKAYVTVCHLLLMGLLVDSRRPSLRAGTYTRESYRSKRLSVRLSPRNSGEFS